MNVPQRNLALAKAILRQVARNSSSSTETVAPRFQRLKKYQSKFGIDDGTPVYLKGGFMDKVLYQFTLGVTALGVGLAGETFYRLAFGKPS